MNRARKFLEENKEEIQDLLEPILELYLHDNMETYEDRGRRVRQSLVTHFANLARENAGVKTVEVPEMVDTIKAIELIEKIYKLEAIWSKHIAQQQ